MLNRERSSPSTTTTPIVTVDRITDAHRALFPVLPDDAEYAVSVYRDNVLCDVSAAGIAFSADGLPHLRERAREVATAARGTYWAGCAWCHINNCDERARHELWYRGSESTWRELAA